jgi:xylose isomerase
MSDSSFMWRGESTSREPARAAASRPAGFDFDTKVRRQNLDRADPFHGHSGVDEVTAR